MKIGANTIAMKKPVFHKKLSGIYRFLFKGCLLFCATQNWAPRLISRTCGPVPCHSVMPSGIQHLTQHSPADLSRFGAVRPSHSGRGPEPSEETLPKSVWCQRRDTRPGAELGVSLDMTPPRTLNDCAVGDQVELPPRLSQGS